MNTNFLTKLKYNAYYLMFILSERKKEQKETNPVAQRFLKYNNLRVLDAIKGKKINKVLILLPHCIQNYNCPFKITSDIENCKKCGQCVIGDFLNIKSKFPVEIKIATGGTLARKHIRDIRPDLVMAVACKRDLMSGIHDAFPVKVLGIFNEIPNEPCVNTTVSIKKIEEYLNEIF
ncbi:hypothetical protein IX317_000329 [Fusobacterium sp. DD29]|uniref:DUF116 domain-containing protein n=1 Tax=unclassified Fusobacterium TaxID=2648384 RepID=UPI001B8D02FA|nr:MULTISPECIES: DUF116 domain-containing protein [unclassified Fusobacterium]MBR8700734.1 hypothetical protein [Fusobacterium sp. DD45]MBR8710426.1 hypothetical protein [Fusobacterium sp. DD28]MBR8748670.1 hypothetical protein [Fusobacterium sp. DD29]MBR8751024.1 hypothetical protein [Fusobacterium sp. DD26]MBR8760978.1 hypothetical protein [Fusobacterium sp. DD25]